MTTCKQPTNQTIDVNPFEIRKTVDIKRLKDQLWQELETDLRASSGISMCELMDKLYNILEKCDERDVSV